MEGDNLQINQKEQQKSEQSQQKQTEHNHTNENKEKGNDIDINLITSLEEAKQKGLSKQQMRKVEKRLQIEAKKKLREQKQTQAKTEEKTQDNAKEVKDKRQKGDKNQLSKEYLQQFNNQKVPIPSNKKLPTKGEDNILVTSALPYVNNVPHLGNIIGCVLSADVYARFLRLHGANVLYICGTDEYGTATQVKALEEKKTPRQICDHFNKLHSQVYKWFDISFDYFGRTSTEWHSKITQQIFLDLQKQNRITQQEMTQCYCENCDLFLADRFVYGICPYCEYQDARGDQCDKCQKLFNSPTQMKNYSCKICKKQPVLRDTTHFFINLPQIQSELHQWVQKSCLKGKWSENSIATTRSWINMGLKPKCITRDLKWGVSVPIEQYKQKVFYVWFDAPIGYISITANLLGQDYKSWWQSEDVKLYQFMGKDNIPFHTVIFPSALIGSRKPWTLLHHISTTEYLNYESGKFSKSRGVGVFGDGAAQTGIPSEVWRYYLLVNRPQKSDSQFCWKDFAMKNNNELLANLGNLCLRTLKFCYSNYQKKIPKIKLEELEEGDINFLKLIQDKYAKYRQLLHGVEIKEGLKIAMQISSLGNKYLQDSKFWQIHNKQSGRSTIVTGVVCNFIRLVSLLVEPYLPSTSAKINFLLGIQRTQQDDILGKTITESKFPEKFAQLTIRSTGLREPAPLFREFSKEEVNTWRDKFAGKNS